MQNDGRLTGRKSDNFHVMPSKSPTHPPYFVGEGRVPFKHLGDVPNNYQFWGGLRVLF